MSKEGLKNDFSKKKSDYSSSLNGPSVTRYAYTPAKEVSKPTNARMRGAGTGNRSPAEVFPKSHDEKRKPIPTKRTYFQDVSGFFHFATAGTTPDSPKVCSNQKR
jgi:hypothetical protein